MAKNTRLAIVIPCFNEQESIKPTTTRLLEVLDDLTSKEKISKTSYIYLIDDGSTDRTWSEIIFAKENNKNRIKGVRFTTNFGNQKAILAGLLKVKEIGCDAVITLDADLQQDENKIEEFIDRFDEGNEIVYGVRKDRKTDSLFKKVSALAFYKLMNILGVKIPKNHSDYRLVSAKILEVLEQYKETDLFLRGFFHEIGFKKCLVAFEVKPRKIGKSKFNFFSLMSLAANGITSYSIVPLKLIGILGFISMIFGFIAGIWAIVAKLFWNDSPDGWAESIILVSFFGGIQIFCLGVVGEYLGQIFREVKKRPRYLIEEELN